MVDFTEQFEEAGQPFVSATKVTPSTFESGRPVKQSILCEETNARAQVVTAVPQQDSSLRKERCRFQKWTQGETKQKSVQ